MLLALTLLATPAFAGSKGDARIEALEARVQALEAEVEALQGLRERVDRMGVQRPSGFPEVDQDKERAAAELLKEINSAFELQRFDEARAKLAELNEKFPGSRASRAGTRISDELAVIGTEVGELEVERWFRGDTSFDDGKATLVVFWELWCPHCKREVPKLEAMNQKYRDSGLNMVGLTKMSRDVKADQVEAFIAENNVTYAMGLENGQALSELFGVRGIPAAAVVQDGKIVWRGHPARITDEMVNGWLQ